MFMFVLCVLNIILFAFGTMVHQRGDQVILTLPYYVIFCSYFFFFIICAIYLILHNRRLSQMFDKRTFTLHLIGGIILLAGGMIDLCNLSIMKSHMFLHIPSFSIFGVIGFGIVTAYAFTERLVHLINEHTKLNLAYTDLEKARSLISVGKSTAILNHEIRDSLFSVLFHTEKIRKNSNSDESRVLCGQIITSINNVLNLNHDLLNMSKKRILESKDIRPVDIACLITDIIRGDYTEKEKIFHLLDFSERPIIYCNKERMNDAMMRLFNYSISKGSTKIDLRLYKDTAAILLIIDDNIKDIAASSTTGNTGFIPNNGNEEREISMIRSTIEANGGHINIYGKNCFNPPEDGLVYNIALPNYDEEPLGNEANKNKIVLIKNGISNFESMIEIFHNVYITPHIVFSHKEIVNKFDSSYIILGEKKELLTLRHLVEDYRMYVVASNRDGRIYIETIWGTDLGLLSEQMIIHEFLQQGQVNSL